MTVSKAKKTRSSFGSKRQLPSKLWQIRYRDNDGVERTGAETYATPTAADLALAAVQTDLNRRTWSDPTHGRIKLDAYAEQWVEGRRN